MNKFKDFLAWMIVFPVVLPFLIVGGLFLAIYWLITKLLLPIEWAFNRTRIFEDFL